MDALMVIVVLTIAITLVFDVINGFHDAANSIATIVSTRVLSPTYAVFWAAFFNFIAMFIFAPKVANTISKIVIINSSDPAFVYVVLSGLLGATLWNLLTWWYGLPSSSSHALIGGLIGSGIAHKGIHIIHWKKILEIAVFIPIAPLIGVILGSIFMIGVFWIFRKKTPRGVDHIFRRGQFVSAALYSLGHGGNDAQKSMGVIVAVLVAAGIFTPDIQLSLSHGNTLWIIVSCQLAMAIGTAMGGWRIVETIGMKLTKLKPVHGFCAETAGAVTIFFATHLGVPVSTTHTIAGSIVGVSIVTALSKVSWIIALRIVWAWILTIPVCSLIGAWCFLIMRALSSTF